MNKEHVLPLLALALIISGFVVIIPGQGQSPKEEWSKTYGRGGTDGARSIQQTTDGGYIIAGYTSHYGSGGAWLVKIDANGTEQWNETYGGAGFGEPTSVLQTSNGGYILAGETLRYDIGQIIAWLLKTDSEGKIEWNKTYGGGETHLYSIRQTSDGGYIAAGERYNRSDGYNDAWLLKTNSNGTTEWSYVYGGTGSDNAYSCEQTADGGYILAGRTSSCGAGGYDAWLAKTDLNGVIQWNRTYGGTGFDEGYSVQQGTGGGYVLCAATWYYTAGLFVPWLVKTDSNGNSQWNKTYDEGVGYGYDTKYSVGTTTDGGYIIIGSAKGTFSDDFWLAKTDSNGTLVWDKTYGGDNLDRPYSAQQTSDGGYVIAGYTYSFGAGGEDVWVVKTDSNGTVQWDKTYGGDGENGACSAQQTSDGGFIIAGYAAPYGSGKCDAWIVKTGWNGTIEWNRTCGGAGYDVARSIRQVSDGGYIVAGYTSSYGAGKSDVWLVKLDPNGFMSWNRTYGGSGDDWASSVQQTSDGGYIVGASTKSFGSGGSDFWLIKTDTNGTAQWNKTYGGANDELANSVQQTADGGYIVAGNTQSFGAGHYDAWLVKTDATGNIQWEKAYGGTGDDWASCVQQTTDGGYIMGGDTDSNGSRLEHFWLVRMDQNGTVLWSWTNGAGGEDTASWVRQTSDGGYIITGMTVSNQIGGLLVKTDSHGNLQWTKSLEGRSAVLSIQQTSDEGYVIAGMSGAESPGLIFDLEYPFTISGIVYNIDTGFWFEKVTAEQAPPPVVMGLFAVLSVAAVALIFTYFVQLDKRRRHGSV